MTGRLLTLLRAWGETTMKKSVTQMTAWSYKYGEYVNGDPELHYAAGSVFAEGMTSAAWAAAF